MYPCPTWIPNECSREWYETHRKGHYKEWDNEKKGYANNDRRNPVYCFESVGFPVKKGKHSDQRNAAYEEALNKSSVAEHSQ